MESSPWTLGKNAVGADVDEQLRAEPQNILRQLRRPPITSRMDAWQVVDAETGNVLVWSGDAPALYPGQLNDSPWSLHLRHGEIWLARSAATERLEAVSAQALGSIYGFVLFGLAAFSLGTLLTYPLAKRFVRAGVTEPMQLEEAIRSGESEIVEFKQEVKERQQLLKDVTAFANTNGGTVFIGIVDGTGEVVGIDVATADRRDAFERALRDSIRNSIDPPPEVIIDYPSKDGRTVARILVLAGRELHSFEGRYYKREGSQSRYLQNGEIGRL
jgi:hypothetical protein